MSQLPPATARRLDRLPAGLRDHVDRSRDVASRLAERYGVDPDRVDLAVATHDLARALKPEALLAQACRLDLAAHPVDVETPILLHGPVAARWLATEDDVKDEEVLEAVRYHTTGRKGMSTLAKVVFLADKLDPQKVAHKPHLERVAALATDSLDAALLEYLDAELASLLGLGALIHPHSVDLRNELTMAVRLTP
jgi:nicotinate-nucleotide adenylyltransferase